MVHRLWSLPEPHAMRNQINSPLDFWIPCRFYSQAFGLPNPTSRKVLVKNVSEDTFGRPFFTDPFILEKNLATLAALENLDCIVSSSNL